MHRIAASIIVLSAFALTGCAAFSGARAERSAPSEMPTMDPACLEVSDGAVEALQGGMVDGYTVKRARAVADETSWWVAATVHAEADGRDIEAAWWTSHDPTVEADNAYVSATKLASLMSVYKMPDDLSLADVVQRTIACLGD